MGVLARGESRKDICCDMVKRLREHRELAQELSGRGHLSVLEVGVISWWFR